MPDMMGLAEGIAEQIVAREDLVSRLTKHGPSVGSHREEVLRDLLRERLPKDLQVETGFVLTHGKASPQVDILIVDSNRPVLARGADGVVFVTPDCVRGMIEVKSRLSGKPAYESALKQLADSVALCTDYVVWTGLFAHGSGRQVSREDGPDDTILDALTSVARETGVRVHSVCVGGDLFVRFWEDSAGRARGIYSGEAWHSYYLERLAPAYFIGNFVAELSHIPEEYSKVWFPIPGRTGKEEYRRWYAAVDRPPCMFPEYEGWARKWGLRAVLARAEKWGSDASRPPVRSDGPSIR
jgi:hypothetical protein